MANMTTSRKNSNDEPEVFARTPEPLLDESGKPARCEFGDQFAPFIAQKEDPEKGQQKLYFCGHHVRAAAESLTAKGWDITPGNYAF